MQPYSPSPPNPVREGFAPRGLVDVIAKEMWLLYGRNGTLNWGGVERHLRRIVEQSRRAARGSREVLVSMVTGEQPATRGPVRGACARRTAVHGDQS